MSVVFILKDILGLSIFVSGGSDDCKNGSLKVVDISIFSWFKNIESYHSDPRGIFTKSPIWSGVGGFIGRLVSFFPISCMCLILFNMNIFYWILVLMMSLYLRAVMTFNLLHFPVSFWPDMASKTFWTDVGSFLPMLRIQTVVLFLSGNAWSWL